MTESVVALIEAYLRDEVAFEEAARELSRAPVFHLSSDRFKRKDHAKLQRLFSRSQTLAEEERLVDRGYDLPPIHAWEPPANPEEFCLSIEVVLRGRDKHRDYRYAGRLYLCTPSYVMASVAKAGWTWLPSPLVIACWDPALVYEAIDARFGSIAARRWTELVEEARLFLVDEG